MRNSTKIYLFDERTSRQISSIASMPNSLTDNYLPATVGAWGEYLASSICDDGAFQKIIEKALPDNDTIDLSKLSVFDILHENFDLCDKAFVLMPSLIGKSFDLMCVQEERDIPENVLAIIEKHKETLLWIRSDIWDLLNNEHTAYEKIHHSSHRMDAMMKNVESVVYIASFFPRKNAPKLSF